MAAAGPNSPSLPPVNKGMRTPPTRRQFQARADDKKDAKARPRSPRRGIVWSKALPAVMGLVAVSLRASGQQAENTNASDRIVISDVRPEDTVLPTERPISSVYGTDLSILDTPRSVSTITRAQLEARDIRSINDVNQFSSAVSTQSRYGLEAVPIIRGDLGEVYQNGIRKEYNRNGFPINFNSVEAIDVVKGPGTVVFGPSFQSGGYVNFVTKRPFFDKLSGEITETAGSYIPGGNSYENFRTRVDVGGPLIKDKLAFRVSFEDVEASSYYQNVKDHEKDVYVALSYYPTPQWKFDFNADLLTTNFNENIGLNRVTQQFIDSEGSRYTTGPGVQGTPGFGAFQHVVPSATAGTSKLYGWQTLVAPQDGAYAKVFNLQLVSTYVVNEHFSIVNRDYYEQVEREKFSAYRYTELAPREDVFENRLEFVYDFKIPLGGGRAEPRPAPKGGDGDGKDGKKAVVPPPAPERAIQFNFISGLAYRHDYANKFLDFGNEAIGAYDLTQSSTNFTYANFTGGPQEAGLTRIPGSTHFAQTSLQNNNTAETILETLGIFHQMEIKLPYQFTILGGARLEWDFPTERANLTNPGDLTPSQSHTFFLTSYNGSLTFKPIKPATLYITYNRTQAINGSYIGGLTYNPTGIDPADFHNVSRLYEAGAKFDLIPGHWFAAVSGFYQKRQRGNRNGDIDQIIVHGVELESTYELNRNFNVTANFTYQKARYDGAFNLANAATPQGFQLDSPLYNFNTNLNFAPLLPNPLNPDVPGVPRVLFNTFATYTSDLGIGASLGLLVQGSQNLDILGRVQIPAQYQLNAALFYKRKNFEVKLDVFNLTDRRNYTPIDTPFFGGDLVLQELPLNAQLTLKFKF